MPELAPAEPPAIGPASRPGPQAPSAVPADAGSVAIRSLVFEGATAFPTSRLTAAAGDVVGPAVPVAALERARAAVVSLYREAGYPFVVVDVVVDANATAHLKVTEGFITEVRLDGDIGPAGTQVLRFLDRLVGVKPLSNALLERQLLLAQDMPGIAIRTVLSPAGTEAGALSLVAQVSRRPMSGYLTADNRGARYAGPEQALGALQFNSFTEFGERTELALFYAGGATQLFGQISTEAYIGGSGLRVRLYAGRGRAHPGSPLRALGFEGDTTVAGASATYPLIRSRSQTLNLITAFDTIESEIKVDDAGEQVRFSKDALRVVRLGGDYALFDLLLGEERPASNIAALRFSQGINGLGAEAGQSQNSSRIGAKAGFTKVGLDVTRTQALFSLGPRTAVSLQGTVAGQWTNDVLPPSEKFYLGGNRLGRGFFTGEVTGDRAVAGSAELQLSTLNETQVFGYALRIEPTYYVFFDHGRTYEKRDEDPNRHLSSAGLGVRASINNWIEAQLEGVHRLTRRVDGSNVRPLKEDALFWRVLTRF